MVFFVLRLIAAAASILLSVGPSRADEVLERLFFRDGTSVLGLEQLRQQDFQPFTGAFSAGYGKDTIWLRLRVRPDDTALRRTMVVRVRPPLLDQVIVYGPDGKAHVTGDFYPGSGDGYRSTNLNAKFDFPPEGGDIFVSVQSDTARLILAEVLTIEEAARNDAAQLAISAAYCVLVLISALLAGIYWFRNPEPLFGWFIVRQCSELLYLTMNLGIARYVLSNAPDRLVSRMTDALNIIYIGVSITFVYVLISEYRAARVTHYAFRFILLCWVGAVVLCLTNFTMEALRLNVLVALSTTIILIPAAISTAPSTMRDGPVIPKLIMVGMCLIISVSGASADLIHIGILDALLHKLEFTLYAAQIHGFVTTLCMTSFMYVRSVRLAAEHEQSARMLIVARIQAEQHRQSRDEQEKLLSMLAHELRTPIAVMKMQLGPWLSDVDGIAELRLAVEEMAAVLDKTVEAGQVSDGALSLDLMAFDLAPELHRASTRLEIPSLKIDAEGLGKITNDLILIRIVLNNLVENAFKYGSLDHVIIIKARQNNRNNSLRLSVINNKSEYGLPDSQTVFQKYSRGSFAYRKTGSGLGLFIVDTIAKRLGGAAFYEQDGDLVEFGVLIPANLEPSTWSETQPITGAT
jgi:signal transduction histidine kinase